MNTLKVAAMMLVLLGWPAIAQSLPAAGGIDRITSGAAAFEGGPQEVSFAGRGFLQAARVSLVRAGFNPIPSETLAVVGDDRMTARFTPGVGTAGRWSVLVDFRDGSQSVLADAIEVLPLDIQPLQPQVVGNCGTVRFEVTGVGLDRVGRMHLVAPDGSEVPSSSIETTSTMRAVASFRLDRAPAGSYGVRAELAARPETTRGFANRLTVEPLVLAGTVPSRLVLEEGSGVLTIHGSGFEAGSIRAVSLVRPDRAIPASSWTVLDANRIEARFAWNAADLALLADLFHVRVEKGTSIRERVRSVRIAFREIAALKLSRMILAPGTTADLLSEQGFFPSGAKIRLQGPRTWETLPSVVDAQTLRFTIPSDLAPGRYSLSGVDFSGRIFGVNDLVWVGQTSYSVMIDARPIRLGGTTRLRGSIQNTGTLPIRGSLGIYGSYVTVTANSWSASRTLLPGQIAFFAFDVSALTIEEIQALQPDAVDSTSGTVRSSLSIFLGDAPPAVERMDRVTEFLASLDANPADLRRRLALAGIGLICNAPTVARYYGANGSRLGSRPSAALDRAQSVAVRLSSHADSRADFGRWMSRSVDQIRSGSTDVDAYGTPAPIALTPRGGGYDDDDDELGYTPQGGGYDDDDDPNTLPPMPGSGGGEVSVNLGGSWDPNAKTEGHDSEFVPQGDALSYRISFENAKGALFAADRVVIEDRLPDELDPATIEMGPMSHAAEVHLDSANGLVMWTFDGINLPPGGEGFVSYVVRPRAGLPAGTKVTNRAVIRFDRMPAVPVSNTVTLVAPTGAPDAAGGASEPSVGTLGGSESASRREVRAGEAASVRREVGGADEEPAVESPVAGQGSAGASRSGHRRTRAGQSSENRSGSEEGAGRHGSARRIFGGASILAVILLLLALRRMGR